MSYRYKQYESDFEILGKLQGWHYGKWLSSFPKAYVLDKARPCGYKPNK